LNIDGGVVIPNVQGSSDFRESHANVELHILDRLVPPQLTCVNTDRTEHVPFLIPCDAPESRVALPSADADVGCSVDTSEVQDLRSGTKPEGVTHLGASNAEPMDVIFVPFEAPFEDANADRAPQSVAADLIDRSDHRMPPLAVAVYHNDETVLVSPMVSRGRVSDDTKLSAHDIVLPSADVDAARSTDVCEAQDLRSGAEPENIVHLAVPLTEPLDVIFVPPDAPFENTHAISTPCTM